MFILIPTKYFKVIVSTVYQKFKYYSAVDPSVSKVLGCHTVYQYSKRITFQISSVVRCSSQGGIADDQGVDSLGSPGPPLDTRQNRKDS
jgi:hypothetical protein